MLYSKPANSCLETPTDAQGISKSTKLRMLGPESYQDLMLGVAQKSKNGTK